MPILFYLIWISIPATMLVLYWLLRLLQLIAPRDNYNPDRMNGIYRLSLVLLTASLLSVLFDQLVLLPGKYSGLMEYEEWIRIVLFPSIAFLTLVGSSVLALLKERNNPERLNYQTESGGFSLLVCGLLFLGVGFAVQSNVKMGMGISYTLAPDRSSVNSNPAPSLGRVGNKWGRFMKTMESYLGEVNGIAAFSKSSKPATGVHPLDMLPRTPDFNRKSFMEFRGTLKQNAEKYGLDPLLVQAMVQIVSGFDPEFESEDGRRGIMQLTPEVAELYKVKDPADVRDGIRAGMEYLRDLINKYKGDVHVALAAYRIGPDVVDSFGGRIPPYKLPESFVDSVVSTYTHLGEEK